MTNLEPQAKKSDLLTNVFIVLAFLLALSGVVFTIYELVPFYFKPDKSLNELSGMFGGISALFSGLAFAGLIITLRMQMKMTHMQGIELLETRKEMINQREQLELQNRTFKLQTFDSIFFQMVALHNQIVSELSLETPDGLIVGRDCFHHYYDNFLGIVKESSAEEEDDFESIHQLCNRFFGHLASDLGHYFRNLYTTIKLVDQSSVENKRRYTNILRAQLSGSELALLFYNCLSKPGEDFKLFAEEYSLLKNLPDELLVAESNKTWFAERSYASSVELEGLQDGTLIA